MKILFISNKSAYASSNFGGAESSMKLLSEHLSLCGHSVYYITKCYNGCYIPRIITKRFGKVEVHIFKTSYLHKYKLLRYLDVLIFNYKVKKIINNIKFDIAYCFYEIDIVNLLLKYNNKNNNMRIVMRIAGMRWYEKCIGKKKLIKKYEYIFNQVDSVNVISDGLKIMLYNKINKLKMNVMFKNEFVLDIGSSIIKERKNKYTSVCINPFNIVVATRFSDYQKRQDILVKSLALVSEKYNIKVKFIGSGINLSYIQDLADQLNLQDRVEFIPFLPQEKLWDELEKSNLLCHPCDYEGLGKIIIESMALGLPVLVSDVLPLSMMIRDGDNGFLVDNNAEQWASKIEYIINNDNKRIDVSIKSIKWVNRYYNPKKNVYRYINEFNKIINQNS